jgi:cold shock CspA family protein
MMLLPTSSFTTSHQGWRFPRLQENQRVEFTAVHGATGPQAKEVHPA